LTTGHRLLGWSEIHRASAAHRNSREYKMHSPIMSADAERQKIMFKMLWAGQQV
jgi:hypothetical protein